MPFPVQIKRSGTAAATPSSLLHGEVALNYADGKVFWKDASNVIQSFTFQAYAPSSHTHAASEITSGTLDAARIANDSVTYAKLQNVSATDRLLGRSSAGSGDVEEITCTAFGRSLIDDADAAAARTTLSVQPTASPAFTGTFACGDTVNIGTASATNTIINVGNGATGNRFALIDIIGDTTYTDYGLRIGRDNNGANGQSIIHHRGTGEIAIVAIDAGSVQLGTSSTARLTISSAGVSTFSGQLLVTAGSASAPGVSFSGDANTGEFSPAADNWAVATGGTERVRIDASGNVGVGNIVPTHRLDCNGEFRLRGTGASTEAGKLHLYWVSSTNRATWTTDASGNALIETGSSSPAERFRVGVNGRSQFFAANEKYGIQLNKSTTANGPFIGSDGADIFTVSASGGGELLRIDAGGNVLVNTTSGDPAGTNATSGCCIAPSSYISVTRSAAPCLYVNRKTDDGTIVSIHQDGTAEGSISVSGTTVSYNAFCGSHWAQLIDNSRPSILRGTVLETIDEMCEWPEGKSDRLVRVKVSDTPRSSRVYGVFMGWDEEYASTGDLYATALGAYMVRVSGVVQSGDLLESAGDGTARTQSDDIVRSSTIGKVSSTHRVAEYDDGSYLVPCVLMCG